jgi:6-pyruvoyltetrahydropterin/6-carboxytetrahydropterin synthase
MTFEVTLLRIVEFSAAHHYHRQDWTVDENARVFGDQVNPHGHNYRVEIGVRGPLDDTTGFVVGLVELDQAISDRIVGPLHNRDLNVVIPEIRQGAMQPSTEALAVWIGTQLAPEVPPPARLTSIRIWESETLGAEVRFPDEARPFRDEARRRHKEAHP